MSTSPFKTRQGKVTMAAPEKALAEEVRRMRKKPTGTTSDLTLVGGALFRQATLHAV